MEIFMLCNLTLNICVLYRNNLSYCNLKHVMQDIKISKVTILRNKLKLRKQYT